MKLATPFFRALLCCLFTIVLTLRPGLAATNHAVSLLLKDVQIAISNSLPGDTVLLPAGTTYWTEPLSINKGITVQGAGIDQTVIINLQNVNLTTLTGGQAITISAVSNRVIRLTGISINGSQAGGGIDCGGALYAAVRIDHCKIINSRREGIALKALVAGLIDHCTFINNYLQLGFYPDPHMNTSWQQPLTLGTTNCAVVEDCVFLLQNTGSWDPWGSKFWSSFENGRGARLVFRNNYWTNSDSALAISPILDMHGNQEPVDLVNNTGIHRGTRSMEMYNNVFDNHVSASYSRYCRPVFLRGGTFLMYSNVYVGKGIEGTLFSEEEDGPSRFHFLSSYPGYDQHWMWLWNNTVNGTPITQLSLSDPSDATFLLTDTNVFWAPQPGYQPLAYPHPLTVAAQNQTPPVISVAPLTRDFGAVALGWTAELPFIVQNTGGGTLAGAVSVPAGPFTITSGGSYSLARNGSQTVTVRFSPTQIGSTNQVISFTGAGGTSIAVSGRSSPN
jgi:hypothetical protein